MTGKAQIANTLKDAHPRIDPNDLFGESYGIDWESVPNSEDVLVMPSGLKRVSELVDGFDPKFTPLNKFVQVSIGCQCGRVLTEKTRQLLFATADDYGFRAEANKVFCMTCDPAAK